MTGRTHAVLDRCMDIFLCAYVGMTRCAERRRFLDEFERLDRLLRVWFGYLLMAGITGRRYRMNYRLRNYGTVTLCGYTALFRTGCRAQGNRYCQEQKNARDIWET